jgi:hypothetical protein
MQRQKVDSRVIWSIEYDPAPRTLELEFRDTGDIYEYFDVPPEEHAAVCSAESKGAYLNQVFVVKGYRYRRIR